MRNISKSFAGVNALKDVTFRARSGKVNVLIGENGAGKSTLMKILNGAESMDSGEILIDGKVVEINSPMEAIDNKLAMIYQELNMAEEMTVAENFFLGIEPRKGPFVDKKKVNSYVKDILGTYRLDIKPTDIVSSLNMGMKQMVEICKALAKNAKIIVMDEPTSSLTQPEVEKLFGIIRRLSSEGVTVIYISHRLEEIFQIGDYITVMRDGEKVAELNVRETNQQELIAAMVGRKIDAIFPKEEVEIKEKILEVRNLTKAGLYNDISFELHRGEILGMSGLIGAGRTEVALTIFGDIIPDSGEILIGGRECRFKSPTDAIAANIAYVPEDRKFKGLDLKSKIRDNISVNNMDRVSRNGFVDREKENELVADLVRRLRIKTDNPLNSADSLSGGNQQKVVLAKWISRDLDVLILDEPTRGVDVGSKEEIHRIVVDLARRGLGIILISSELPEVMNMSDRIVVMHEGQMTGILDAKTTSQEEIMAYATGVRQAI